MANMTFKTNLIPAVDGATSTTAYELGSSTTAWRITRINLPTTSGGSTYGPGSNGSILMSNGSSVYWSASSASGFVQKTGDTMTGSLYVNVTTDTAYNQDTGAIVVGDKAGENIAIDKNDIMARNNKAASTLYINNGGGTIQVGGLIQPKTNNSLSLGTTSLRWGNAYVTNLYVSSNTGYTASNSTVAGTMISAGSINLTTASPNIYFHRDTAAANSGYILSNAGYGLQLNGASSTTAAIAITGSAPSTGITYNSRTIKPILYANGLTYVSGTIEASTSFINNIGSTGGGYYLYNNNIEYGRLYINKRGTAAVSNGEETPTYSNTAGEAILTLGNNKQGTSGNSASVIDNAKGIIRIYGPGTTYTDIQSKSNSNKTFYLPSFSSNDMYAVHTADGNAVGNAGLPVYVAANGRVTACVPFTTCSVAVGTAAKTGAAAGFTATTGSRVIVNFTAGANTANSPTLNINSTGAKQIYHRNAQITNGTNKALLQGACEFVYDGTRYHLVGNYYDTTYSAATTSAAGLMPALPSSNGTSTFLRGDGTWQKVLVGATGDNMVLSVEQPDTTIRTQLASNNGGNHGIYSNGYWNGSSFVSSGKWLVYRDTANNIILNGNAQTATALSTSSTTAQYWRGDNTWADSVFIRGTGTDSIVAYNSTSTNTATGKYAIAGGKNTTASGDQSIAWGLEAIASGTASLAIGGKISGKSATQASDNGSIAIGASCLASGPYAFASGQATIASNNSSIAMGYQTEASGAGGLAAGVQTNASGRGSAAIGANTIASGRSSMAIGQFNIEDTDTTTYTSYGSGARKYLFTIGNGTADNARSNAMTVDWEGNQWNSGILETNTGLAINSLTVNNTHHNYGIHFLNDGNITAQITSVNTATNSIYHTDHLVLKQFSYNSSSGAKLSTGEIYNLPTVTPNLAESTTYQILTTKTAGETVYYIVGPSTDSVGVWTGTDSRITAYYDGLTVLYVPGVAGGSSTTTLNINGLGAVQCYTTNTSAMTIQYGVGTPILLTYSGSKWRRADYNSNTNTLQRTFRSSTNIELPLAGISTSSTTAAAYSAINSNSYKDVYAAIPETTTNVATLNPSNGRIIVPGGIKLNTLVGNGTAIYGDTLPTTAETGQIFFQTSTPAYELPAGGTAGYVLVKNSASDRDVIWTNVVPRATADADGNQIATTYVLKTGDTMSGNLILSRSTEGQMYVRSTNPNGSVELLTSTNRGVYDRTNTKWIIELQTSDNTVRSDYQIYGAVWNDYAEFRETSDIIEPGRCIIENGDDTLSLSTQRLQRGCEIVSDTFGFAIGQTEKAKTPTAASGRVLAYLLEDKEEAKKKIGWPVCSGPNGTVSIMTEEEEEKYPSRIIGTISSVPKYDIWYAGTDGDIPIKVNGRIWIRVR